MYEVCFFCPATEQARKKLLPFGNRESADILVVLPNFSVLTEEQRCDLQAKYENTYFVYFVACHGLDDHIAAELPCSVLLRNESRPFAKVLIFDSPVLKDLFGASGGIFIRPDGVKVGVYRGSIFDSSFVEEFGRLKNG